ncbi:lytic transglycosylase domain-containing protein [Kordiimonas pumila]|uniref:Transglycosylase SLT domain-containing protein n=1 Tax=Kordiimonas pumila TaxID=2161677 RepID=A0ABV7D901_9PROT|nr:lytic transglycosylase domain-containing protein [Kordiimonas pumila]
MSMISISAIFRNNWFSAFALCTCLFAVSEQAYSAPQTSSVIPEILTAADIERYQEIFALQEQAQWQTADKLIKKLKNPILLGHVEFQRYMHPTGYRSKFNELSKWLSQYADHPDAWRLYRLARKRQGKAATPQRPIDTRYPGVTGQAGTPKPPLPPRNIHERRSITTFAANVRKYVRKGEPEWAEKRYWAMERRDLLVPHEKANALERIAASYYYKGNDEKAIILASLAADLARESEPESDWIAGLALWRTGDIEGAYKHFKLLSDAEQASDWLLAAGNFWASRSALRFGDYDDSISYLKRASTYHETFYGLLAGRQLGIIPDIDWSVPELTKAYMQTLLAYPATKRALALAEIGRNDMADEELRLLWGREGTDVQSELLALSAALNLPALQTRLGRAGGTGETPTTATRYPLPDWEPAGGFNLDKALIFAMVKKESDFRIQAKSRVGAGGLMQVMPSTAHFITKKGSLLRRNSKRLYEPEFNMALGQRYIEYLMEMDYVEGNLFMTLAAYNGGPGSLMSWRREVDYGADPLLFIESIGFYETRNYIERVMANLWLYRMRMGQDTPSLDAIAAGAWPILERLDTEVPESPDEAR